MAWFSLAYEPQSLHRQIDQVCLQTQQTLGPISLLYEIELGVNQIYKLE